VEYLEAALSVSARTLVALTQHSECLEEFSADDLTASVSASVTTMTLKLDVFEAAVLLAAYLMTSVS